MDWRKTVKTISTFPPAKIFTRKARTIADTMAKPEVSPKGLGSAIKMIQYHLNRGGSKISTSQREELEKAKKILQRRMHKT